MLISYSYNIFPVQSYVTLLQETSMYVCNQDELSNFHICQLPPLFPASRRISHLHPTSFEAHPYLHLPPSPLKPISFSFILLLLSCYVQCTPLPVSRALLNPP